MRLKTVALIIFCSLISSSFVLLNFHDTSEASGNEIYVHNGAYAIRDGSAEHPYETIQYAIDLANEGDSIYVFGGTYNETLFIDKNITLIGSIDSGNSIINKNARHRYTIEITADYATLEGFNISETGSLNQVALIYVSSNSVVIQRNNITQSNSYAIYLDSSDDNTIGSNMINDTKGIYFYISNNNVVHSNKISNCSEAAIHMFPTDNNNIIYNNNLSYNKYGVYAIDCSNANISNNIASYNTLDGIKLQSGNDIFISNNILHKNKRDGIYSNSQNVIINNNSIRNSQIGIDLFQSDNGNIKSNTIYYCSVSGVNTESGSNNNIFYLNDFFSNVRNAKESGNNQWYYGTQGNYWDDYNEIDRDLDGIGDTSYIISYGGIDLYPLGYFLKPPNKPVDPSPADDESYVNLRVTLSVDVTDPDGSDMTVFFYNAITEEQCGVDYNVESGELASCNFNLPFETIYAWYAIANDSKLENRSDTWYFITKARPPLNEKPFADPGGPYFGGKDEIIEFDASDSYDPDGTIDFYRWNFGDGTSEILDINPTHVYAKEGEFTVTLTIVDNNGTSDMKTTTVTISDSPTNQDPVANIGGPYSGNVGSITTFNGSSSYDNDGTIASYSWIFGDGSFGTGQTTTHIYSSEGIYTVKLTITDDDGATDTASTTIEISPSTGGGIPGFEIVFIIISISFILILKRRRK